MTDGADISGTLTFVFNKEGMIDGAVGQHLDPADLGHVVRRHPEPEDLTVSRPWRSVTSLLPADYVNLRKVVR